MFGYSIGLGPIPWLYSAEILPEKGIFIATIVNWASTSAITFLFPICKDAFTIGPVFAFFAFALVIGILFFYQFMVES